MRLSVWACVKKKMLLTAAATEYNYLNKLPLCVFGASVLIRETMQTVKLKIYELKDAKSLAKAYSSSHLKGRHSSVVGASIF